MSPRDHQTPLLPDLVALIPSWQLHLRAERKAAGTLKLYLAGVTMYLDFCGTHAVEPLTRSALNAFVVALLDGGAEASTARSRQLAVRRFSAWLVEEDEIDTDPFDGIKPPKLDVRAVRPLSDDELKAILKACSGPDLRDRRDEAIVRLMLETGIRAGELVSMRLSDVDLAASRALIPRGKGGKGRVVPIGSHSAKAIDRYIRLRRGHVSASSEMLWLGERGKNFAYDALHKSLGYRADIAGVEGFHPHRLRHTAAHRWLAAGGTEGGLMAIAGWTRPDMLIRYTRAGAADRAAVEAARLNLGEI